MKFSVSKNIIMPKLQVVAGVTDRKGTMPILANILIEAENNQLTLTGSDLEVEMVATVEVDVAESGRITVPARKFFDIVKNLDDAAEIVFTTDDNKATVRSGRSRFTLSTLPAGEFPSVDRSSSSEKGSISLPAQTLKELINQCSHAMANNDVRYYLNGMLLEFVPNKLSLVGTDGHRMMLVSESINYDGESIRSIVPRKGILELHRILGSETGNVTVNLTSNHIFCEVEDVRLSSKLIDGKFPDYNRVIPKGHQHRATFDRNDLRCMLHRANVLANEKYRGVRLTFNNGTIEAAASNAEQEESNDSIQTSYKGSEISVGFNNAYLLDVINAFTCDEMEIIFNDGNSSIIMRPSNMESVTSVIMPMRV